MFDKRSRMIRKGEQRMEFFEKLGDTIVNVGKDVTQKAKDVSGIAKLDRKSVV